MLHSSTPALHTPQSSPPRLGVRSAQGVLVAVVDVLHPSTHRRGGASTCIRGAGELLTCRRGGRPSGDVAMLSATSVVSELAVYE